VVSFLLTFPPISCTHIQTAGVAKQGPAYVIKRIRHYSLIYLFIYNLFNGVIRRLTNVMWCVNNEAESAWKEQQQATGGVAVQCNAEGTVALCINIPYLYNPHFWWHSYGILPEKKKNHIIHDIKLS
jgi:hypothetical protein